jgi:hypothetical protein
MPTDKFDISRHGKVMVHNPMVPLLEYVNAKELQQYIDNLRSLENTMYELYEFFTGLKQEQIKMLMDNETYLDPQQAVDYGFADMVVDIKPKSYEMTANINQKEINMSKTLNILNKVIGMVNKSEFINQIYSDLEGGEIEIYQQHPSTYQVGDRTSMEEGEVVLSDGAKIIVKDSQIVEIDRSVEGEDVVSEDADVEAGDFNEGEAPKMEDEKMEEEVVSEDKEEMMDDEKMESEEVMEDEPKMEEEKMDEHVEEIIEEEEAPAEEAPAAPSKIVETTTQTIQSTKEVIAQEVEEAKEVEAKEEVMEEEVEMKDEEAMDHGDEKAMDDEKMESEEVMEDEPAMEEEEVMEEEKMEYVSMDEYKALEERLAKLEAVLGDYENKFEAISKFENIATEAIDTLASNTVSTFKPEAKAVSAPSATGSIFTQLKAKRGL